MRLLVLSDLHIEHSGFAPDPAVLERTDVVVLAGDIHPGDDGIRWARDTFGADKPIVYVAGNHEFYGHDFDDLLNSMRDTAKEVGVCFLEDESVELAGLRFLGCTLWTDFEYHGKPLTDKLKQQTFEWFIDYAEIKANAGTERLTPDQSVQRHLKSRTWLQAALEKPDQKSTVVVTHHYPNRHSTHPRYANDPMTVCFGSHLPVELMRQAGLWIHGHTHSSFNYRIGDSRQHVRVVCNPRGYPLGWLHNEWENESFNPSMLMQQGPNGHWEVLL